MSSGEAPRHAEVSFGGVTPVLHVRELAASIDYYVRRLGFKVVFQTPQFASVVRGKCGIFLSEGDQGHPGSWVWIGVDDADALHEQLRASGAKVRHEPTNYTWAYEMQVEDLDGNVLRIGSEPKRDQPLGEWLDMRGERWLPLPEGKWRRKA
jgi:catechol 2,3-dioxygenase-like lactoylglutathione lyase family enzyme